MTANKQDKVLNFSSEREQSVACSSSAEREKNQGKNFLNVPTLRFPEFTGNWEKTKLADITKRVLRKNKGVVSERPLTISAQYGLIDQRDFFNKVVASENLEGYYLLKKGEFAYNKSYSNEYPWGAVKRLDSYDEGALSTLYICFECIGVDGDWLVHYFDSPKWNGQVSAIAVEGARNHGLLNVGIEDFFGTQHFVPNNKKEQKKIATFLNLIDERIATQNRIIEDLKSERKYLLEQLFCLPNERVPKLRLKGMTGEWQKVKLCYIANRVTEKNKANTCNRVLTIAAQYGLIDQQEFFNKQIASSDLTTYYLLHKGDFAYNKSYSGDYSWGAVKRLDKYDKGVLSSLYICFRPNENVDSDFLCHYFESTKWYRGISEISGEGARNHGLLNMSVDDYFNTLHRIPTQREQKAVANALNVLVDKIGIETEILNNLQKQKSYLLKEMFI